MERYIQLGRAFYDKTESGIVFYFDEELYYRVCLCIDEKEKLSINRLDKKILIKNVYQKGKKRENLQCVEQQLEEMGFEKTGTSVRIKGEVQHLFEKCKRMEKYVHMLEKKGYRCVAADFSMFEEIEAIILDSGIIKDYQLNYRTDEEKKKLVNGSYMCMLNSNDEMCIGSVCVIESNIAKGVALAVKEKYKMHGLTPAIAFHRAKWFYDNEIKYAQGWILVDNEPSLRYYQSMGYELTNEYADEWIFDK
ncbi:MAG: hypothetical protein J1E83_06045 [Lachnospiraceae bacterium]|nr:hypothetical protein [Lachnospiraceae bacterium]